MLSTMNDPETYTKTIRLLIDEKLVSPDTDLSAFFTAVMAGVMEEFGIAKHQYKPRKTYKLDTTGDTGLEKDLKFMKLESGFTLPRIENLELCGKTICITGQSEHYHRKTLLELAEQAGCVIDKSITWDTDCLVVCEKASKGWVYEKFGNKMKMAVERGITLVAEVDFVTALKKTGVL